MPTQAAAGCLECAPLLDLARARAGLSDFGDTWFVEPMARYLEALGSEACLTDAGADAQREVIVKGLVNRLRMIEDIKRHPQINDETVDVAAVILGLPRTGSTIFQRLLASAPRMTAIRWYELQNYAPFPGEQASYPSDRRAYAQAMIAGWLEAVPELASIHPLDPDAPDEEILILGQMFVSTMLEGMSFIPGFSNWLDGYDQSRGHEDLKTILKYLQWQDPARRGRKWVLKSPSNLPYVEYAAQAFPDALLIMTHRDPLETVPSYISMQAALYALTARIRDEEVARFWLPRLARWMERFQRGRDTLGESRFLDIDYRDVTRDPLAQAQRVLRRMGVDAATGTGAALTDFLEGNRREQRPSHLYSLERFGLTEGDICKLFADYRARYIKHPEKSHVA